MKENNYQSPERMAYNQNEQVNITLVGNQAYAGNPMIFPPICVRCGASQGEGKNFRKKMTFCPSWVYLLLLLSLLVLVIVYYIVRKQVKVHYCLCQSCWESHKTKMILNAAMWVGFFGLIIAAIALGSGELGIFSLVVFIGGLVTAVLASAPLRVVNYDEPNFFVKGFKQAFVEAFESRGGK